MEKFGFSGDTICIQDNHVIKTCNTNQSRFQFNIIKQKKFNNPYIQPVEILEDGINESGKNYIKMPLLRCENSIMWISKANLEDVNQTIKIFHNYFQDLISKSKKKQFNYSIWINKLQELEIKITDPKLKYILSELQNLTFTNNFYYGDYHGDFTLSNLFILKEQNQIVICAIDFLDSFIHSPINDLVKLRQDTKHLWTFRLMKEEGGIDNNKIAIILNYLDQQMENFIKQDYILSEFYLPFQIINLMRIIPYNKNENIFNYLKEEILELFYEFHTNRTLCG